MGNKESSEESAAEELPNKEKDKAELAKREPQLSEINFAELTYNDIYLEESQESGDGLDDYTEVDSDDDSSFTGFRDYPDSVSVMSRIRVFSAWLSFVISYNKSISELTVKLKGTTEVPGRGQGGASAYQVLLTLMPAGKQTVTSKVRAGPNPMFEDTWTFLVPAANLLNHSIRCRLYGCMQGERDKLLSEGMIHLAEINPRVENPISVQTHPPTEASIIADRKKQMEEEQQSEEDELLVQQFLGGMSQSINNVSQLPIPQPLASELLLNAAYNSVTGRLECTVQQAHGIRLPGAKTSKPYSFVRLLLRHEDGNKVLAHSRTKICKKLNNPAFNETFFFSVMECDVDKVTLVVTMFHKKPPRKKVYLGAFSLGLMNTSKTEKDHWDEILASSGQRVARWHKLYTNVL